MLRAPGTTIPQPSRANGPQLPTPGGAYWQGNWWPTDQADMLEVLIISRGYWGVSKSAQEQAADAIQNFEVRSSIDFYVTIVTKEHLSYLGHRNPPLY